ncbi:MAG: nucleotidyltransferase domain-containing protein, partial [Burkholderiaceae bacterium]|nr:nucleotidyltransferase domain-containing protein [Burkholderiaceae bacterium]
LHTIPPHLPTVPGCATLSAGASAMDVICTPVTEALLGKIVERIVAAFDPQMVVLFGSRAYGTPEPDSDVDLLVVTDALADRSVFERHRAVSDLFPRRRFALDVLVRTPAELQQLVEHGPSFFREVMTQGRILYERSSRVVAQS